MPTYADQLRVWREAFVQQHIQTAALDARLLLRHVSGLDAAQLITKDHLDMPAKELSAFNALCQRRLTGEPIARIIGHKEFFGRDFILNDDTLVPRPETELLVETALSKLPKDGRFIDLGTGSGAIAISILAERSDISGMATDLSENALLCAKENAEVLGVAGRLQFVQSDWYADIEPQLFDLIVSNPPYIAVSEKAEMNEEALQFDPELALFAANDGLAAYVKIVDGAKEYLTEGGWLMFEIGHRQASAVSQLFLGVGFQQVSSIKDLSGLDRVVVGQR